MSERSIAQALAEREGGQCEVKTPAGYIDVLTAKHLYEVKEAKDWKAAIGQVLAYRVYYPQHKPRLYLYGKPTVTKKLIEDHCRNLGIGVVWHRDENTPPRTSRAPKQAHDRLDIQLRISERRDGLEHATQVQYHVAVPEQPLTESALQTYLDELRDLLDPVLLYELTLDLTYVKGETHYRLQSHRDYINPNPERRGFISEYGLVILTIVRPNLRNYKIRFPCVRLSLVQGQKIQILNPLEMTQIKPLVAFVTRPGWCWQSSSAPGMGSPVHQIESVYMYRYGFDPKRAQPAGGVLKLYTQRIDDQQQS